MEVYSVLLLLVVLGLVVFYVAGPFMNRIRAVRVDDPLLSSLQAERDRALTAIQELDFDYSLGKISAEEYPAQREALVQNGASILRQLDEYSGPAKKGPVVKMPSRPASSDDELEDLIATRRSARKEKTGGFCPKCGKPVLLSDRFCPKCGHPLK